MAVLEVVEDTQDGTVVIVRCQWSHTDVFKGDVFALVCSYKAFNGKLQIQYLE